MKDGGDDAVAAFWEIVGKATEGDVAARSENKRVETKKCVFGSERDDGAAGDARTRSRTRGGSNARVAGKRKREFDVPASVQVQPQMKPGEGDEDMK